MTAPVSEAGVALPPLTLTLTESMDVDPIELGLPSAEHATGTDEPAGTGVVAGVTVAVTVTAASAESGREETSATNA